MADFNSMLASTARAFIDGLGGEPLTIILPTIPPTTRAVMGIVDRYGPTDMLVKLQNDATTGYSADEAQKYGATQVTLAQYPGGTVPVTLSLMIPTPEEMNGFPWCDAGMCTYRVGNRKR